MNRESTTADATDPIERNVQLAGNSTFVVSLPKEWAIAQGLESGRPMYLYPHEDRLVAAPKPVSARERTTRIDADGVSEGILLRRLRAAYTNGADRIVIDGVDAIDDRLRRSLEKQIGQLIGVEILEVANGRLTVGNLLDVADVSLPQANAQARRLVLEMHEEAIEAVRTDDADLARQVIKQDDDVDRLFAFVTRGFHRGLEDVAEISQHGTDRPAAFCDYRTARYIERIGDHATEIAAVTDRQSGPPTESIGDGLEAIGADARTVIERALAGEDERASETRGVVSETIDELDRRLCERGGRDAYRYGTVLERLRRTATIGMNIVETRAEAADA